MTVPAAPTEGGGDKVLFATDDNGGSNRANLFRGYKHATLNGDDVAELGVYVTSGALENGNRNATGTSALQLSTSSVPCQGVLIKAREANVNDVWVGKSDVTADTTESTGGWRLTPGSSLFVPCRNLSEVYLRWASYTAGDGVEYIAGVD